MQSRSRPNGGPVDIAEMGGPGSMIPTSNEDGTLHGYQRWEDVWGEPGRPAPQVSPVTDDNGKLIGYTGQGIGWITLEAYNAPGFTARGRPLASASLRPRVALSTPWSNASTPEPTLPPRGPQAGNRRPSPVDLFSNRIVGDAISDRMTAQLAVNALRAAMARRQPTGSVVIHSDHGGQTHPHRRTHQVGRPHAGTTPPDLSARALTRILSLKVKPGTRSPDGVVTPSPYDRTRVRSSGSRWGDGGVPQGGGCRRLVGWR